MIDPRQVEEAEVYRNAERVGTIRRTAAGCVFRYLDEFYAAHRALPGGVAVNLPYRQQELEHRGDNLPPYFAGLLPEGLRLKALVRRAKTSEDDMLTLLIAAGPDTVGDLCVVPAGETPGLSSPRVDTKRLEQTSFRALWEQTLEHLGPGEPVVPGVQEKISAAVISFPVAAVSKRKGYILKLDPEDKPRLVTNEHFFMRAASACGIRTAKTWLVHDRDHAPGLLVERFDRRWDGAAKRLAGLHQEDACQLLDRYPAEKYRVKCSEIAESLEVCAAPIPARARFLELLAFSYLIGNGDLHAKNVSVTQSEAGLALSPAYDLLSSLPYGDRRMALQFEGRDDNFKRHDFIGFGKRFGVGVRAVDETLDRLNARLSPWVERVGEIGLPEKGTADLQAMMRKRLADLAEA
ncbi:MAG: type II toxin-antitoxin system HipA family toxin [Myxococcaceae bacterium]